MDLPYNASDVLYLLNYSLPSFSKNSYDMDCPMCKKKKKLNWNLVRSVFRCNACDYYGNQITFYANMMGMTNQEANADIRQRLNLNETVNENQKIKYQPKAKVEPEVKESELADIMIRNKTYRCLENELLLNKKHYEELMQRGFESDFIFDHGYKSYPLVNVDSIIIKLLQLGCDLKGVPGFFRLSNNKWVLTFSKIGILVKYISFNNMIQGFQNRVDDEALEIKDGVKESKYRWVSSRYRNEGCGPKTFVHYACDFTWDTANSKFIPLCRNNTFVLTEGAMKADLFFHLTGQSTIAIPGVNCLKELEHELHNLKSIGVTNIILAYDMDFLTNIHVIEALDKIKNLIIENGFDYKILCWNVKMFKTTGTEYKPVLFVNNRINTFIITKETYDQEKLEMILDKAKNIGITTILLSFKNESDLDTDLINKVQGIVLNKGFIFNIVFWELIYKGIDDYYAYKIRGIES